MDNETNEIQAIPMVAQCHRFDGRIAVLCVSVIGTLGRVGAHAPVSPEDAWDVWSVVGALGAKLTEHGAVPCAFADDDSHRFCR